MCLCVCLDVCLCLCCAFTQQPALHQLVDVFCQSQHFNKNGQFHHLASTFFNVTQVCGTQRETVCSRVESKQHGEKEKGKERHKC